MDFSREIEPDASVAGAFVFWDLFFYPHPLQPPKKKKKSFSLVLMCHPLTSPVSPASKSEQTSAAPTDNDGLILKDK